MHTPRIDQQSDLGNSFENTSLNDDKTSQLMQEIENEFKDLHNASRFLEQDSMLVAQTQFIDIDQNPEFILQDAEFHPFFEVTKKSTFGGF